MKVAIIINTSWNIYNFRKGLIQHFLDRGDSVLAIAPRDEYSEKLEEIGCEFRELQMQNTGMNPIRDISLFFQIRKILKQDRPDVLLSYTIKPNIYGSLASGLLGIPCICNVSGLGTVFLWKGTLKKLAVWLYAFSFRFNRWVFFQNPEDRDEFLTFVNLSPEKTGLLPGSGININDFQVLHTNKTSKVIFLMIARMIVEKGVREYIEAAKILKKQNKDVVFRYIGSLDQSHARSISKEELDKWIADDIIEYQDHLEDVRPAIAEADVIVLPSYREGTPRTLLEGGAMGKALLATDVPGCRHVVHDGENGFLFKPQNANDLADKIKLYLSLSEEEKRQVSMSSRKIIEDNFAEQKVIDAYCSKIDELVKF